MKGWTQQDQGFIWETVTLQLGCSIQFTKDTREKKGVNETEHRLLVYRCLQS